MAAGQLHFSEEFDAQQARRRQQQAYSAAPLDLYPLSISDWSQANFQSMPATSRPDPRCSGPPDMKPPDGPSLTSQIPSPGYNIPHGGFNQHFTTPVGSIPVSQHLDQSIPPSLDLNIPQAHLTDLDSQLSPNHLQIRTSMSDADAALSAAYEASAVMLQSQFNFQMQSLNQQAYSHADALGYSSAYAMPLHTSPVDAFMDTTQAPIGMAVSAALEPAAFVYNDMVQMMDNNWNQAMLSAAPNPTFTTAALPLNSTENAFMTAAESLSSNNDGQSYIMINHSHGQPSVDGFSDISAAVSPTANHIRADSHSSHISDPPHSAASTSSVEELFGFSPEPELVPGTNVVTSLPMVPVREYPFASTTQYEHPLPSPPLPSPQSSVHVSSPAHPVTAAHSPQGSLSASASTSPSAGNSPKAHRRTSPLVGITPKTISKKKATSSKADKKVGKRRGPLRPEQREQAHEIRKLRACLRCRFLKKVCDKGAPCGGCQPSHARLWQVPCTRIDIKEIGYFFKDWTADYQRHVSMSNSIANIKGFGTHEREVYISHGYGFMMPIMVRDVFVRDESCFAVDWVEQKRSDITRDYEINTHKLSVGAAGVSKDMVSNYVDLHLDKGFEHFIDTYFDGTPFLTELLRTIHNFYQATGQANIRTGLRLVIAYALTLHITLINGLSDEEAKIGMINDPESRYQGSTCAPVMINFEVKAAMAELWRELMTEVLCELSALYTAVYKGEKIKSWPSIFMLGSLILSVWEMMQFDAHYREPAEAVVEKFCHEMEHVPVGVVIGLFGAISTRFPGFQEWNTAEHGKTFENNPAVCETMTNVRAHIEKHESYLRNRSDAKFCRDDFDSLSNKFLSKLVIRA